MIFYKGISVVNQGVSTINSAGTSLIHIEKDVQNLKSILFELSSASEEQGATMSEIMDNIFMITRETKNYEFETNQNLKKIQKLNTLLNDLLMAVDKFKI